MWWMIILALGVGISIGRGERFDFWGFLGVLLLFTHPFWAIGAFIICVIYFKIRDDNKIKTKA